MDRWIVDVRFDRFDGVTVVSFVVSFLLIDSFFRLIVVDSMEMLVEACGVIL